MGNFLDLQTEVATALIDTPARVLALVPSFVNRAIRSLQVDHNFRVQKAILTANTVVGTRLLTTKPVSTNFKEWRGRPYRVSNLGTQNRVNWAVANSEVTAGVNSLSTGFPRWVVEDDNPLSTGNVGINVWPLPDGHSDYVDGEYRVFLPYWKYLDDLAASGDTNWFTSNGHEYIVHTASGYGFQYDWDEKRMSVWVATGQIFKERLIKQDKREVLSQVNTLVPHWQGANDAMVTE